MKPRRALWGVVLAVALGLSIAAIATSPAWETPPPDSSLTPPFDEPAIAAIMPDDDVASQAFGTPMVRIIDRPPNTRVYALNTDVAQDYRDVAIEQAWERQWRSPHQMQEAAVIVEVITSATISAPSVTCEAEEPLSIPGADSAGIRVRTDDMTAACAAITRGRTHVGIQINEPSGDDSHLVATLSALVEHIEPLVEETPRNPPRRASSFRVNASQPCAARCLPWVCCWSSSWRFPCSWIEVCGAVFSRDGLLGSPTRCTMTSNPRGDIGPSAPRPSAPAGWHWSYGPFAWRLKSRAAPTRRSPTSSPSWPM